MKCMHRGSRFQGLLLLAGFGLFFFSSTPLAAVPQGSDPAAVEDVRQAVAAELDADRTDKSNWQYRESNHTPEKNAVYTAVETPQGTLRRLIELGEHPLNPDATAT